MPPYAINGSGRAPAAASVEWFQEQGIDAIDFESPHAVTVPGAVGTWERLLADHGTKGLDEVLQPAIRYARRDTSSIAEQRTTGRAPRGSSTPARTRALSTCPAGGRPEPAISIACRRWRRRSV